MDKQRVRSYVAGVRPEIVSAFRTIMLNRDIRFFSRVFDNPEPVAFPRTGYCYAAFTKNDRKVAVLWHNEIVIARGSTSQLFLFAAQYHPHACKVICAEVRKYPNNQGYVPGKVDGGDLVDALDQYRLTRKAAEGLNAVTKMAQLRAIEQDHTIVKFDRCSMYAPTTHYGSGWAGGTIFASDEPVHCLDPLINNEGDSGFDVFGVGHDAPNTIYSDVAVGDELGMKTDPKVVQLRKKLTQKAAEGVLVYLKLDVNDPDGPPGRPLFKPRPHNAEVIWEVQPGGKAWAGQVAALRDNVRVANQQRMEKLFTKQGTDVIKPVFPTQERVARVVERPFKLPPPNTNVAFVPFDAFMARVRSRPMAKVKKRKGKWAAALHAFSIGDFMSLSHKSNEGEIDLCSLPKWAIRRGPLLDQDPLIGPVDYSLRSIFTSARRHGWACIKTPDGWVVQPERAENTCKSSGW